MTDCLITDRASGPCQKCGEYQRAAHICDGKICCEEHCPAHRVSHEWKASKPIEGEQLDLIGGMKGSEEYPG